MFATALTLSTVATATGAALPSAAENYKVDPVHSAVLFRIKHLNVSYFHGRFNETTGTFTYDRTDPANCAFDVTVHVDSLDTHSADRDRHVKSAQLLNAAEFGVIRFKSTKVAKAGADKYRVTGELSFHGTTKTITTTLERVGSGDDPWGGYRTGFETVFTIKRSDFGMGAMQGMLGDEVRLTVSLEGVRQ
jgi:polyisoprenoid-binding protein YceI